MKYPPALHRAAGGWSPPSRGAWIEIPEQIRHLCMFGSPPSRGAWIEITTRPLVIFLTMVAPLAGGVD